MKLDFHQLLTTLVEQAPQPFLVAGGVAVNLHGAARFTYDLDLYVSEAAFNPAAWQRVLAPLGHTFRQRVEAEEPRVRLVQYGRVDVILKPAASFAFWWARRVVMDRVPVLNLTDLIQEKRNAGREVDLLDVRRLREIVTL